MIPILCAESIADTNTDTFAKSIGDTFTPILLPILLPSYYQNIQSARGFLTKIRKLLLLRNAC